MRIPIEISELRKGADGDTVKGLADFLEERLEGFEVEMTGSEIALSYEEEDKQLSRPHLRVLLRKFLHREDLKEFRVIGGRENAFVIKRKRLATEE